MPVRIVTDSASDLPQDLVDKYGIQVVPLTIRFGSDEFTDGVDLSTKDFYAKLAQSQDLPETAAPSPGAFEEAFRKAGADGDPVLCINLSEQLSATMASAQNAAKAVQGDIDVQVVDSASITAGEGTQVLRAAEAAAEGQDRDAIVAVVEDLRSRTRIFGALDTLENLKKGGRIGGAQAMLGSLLNIKPLVDISTGHVEEAGKQRTRKKSLVWLRDRLFEEDEVENLCVCSGEAPDVQELIDLIAPRYGPDQYRLSSIGPVIGTHGGPRVLGFSWTNKA